MEKVRTQHHGLDDDQCMYRGGIVYFCCCSGIRVDFTCLRHIVSPPRHDVSRLLSTLDERPSLHSYLEKPGPAIWLAQRRIFRNA